MAACLFAVVATLSLLTFTAHTRGNYRRRETRTRLAAAGRSAAEIADALRVSVAQERDLIGRAGPARRAE